MNLWLDTVCSIIFTKICDKHLQYNYNEQFLGITSQCTHLYMYFLFTYMYVRTNWCYNEVLGPIISFYYIPLYIYLWGNTEKNLKVHSLRTVVQI